ncbi:MAG: glycerol acyltransferase, partial [Deltaproteobacteria bacterium]|nr:glycerol acyltransferase [Deltaproteobacteria bacterium]
IPWGFTLGLPPPWIPFPSKILVEVLEPIVFEGTSPADADDPQVYRACARQVQATMQAALTRLCAEL